VAAQHGLVVPGPVRFFQPDQDLGLQLREPERVGQRALHGPVPLRPGQRIVIPGGHGLSLAAIPERNLRPRFRSVLDRLPRPGLVIGIGGNEATDLRWRLPRRQGHGRSVAAQRSSAFSTVSAHGRTD
jgi:hypothetical protein